MNDIIKLSPRFHSVCIDSKTKKIARRTWLRETLGSVYSQSVCACFSQKPKLVNERKCSVQTIKSPLIINRPINQSTNITTSSNSRSSFWTRSPLLFDNIFSLTLLSSATYAITQTSRASAYLIHQTAAIRRLLFTHKVPLIVRAAYILLNSAAAAWYTQHHPLYLFKYTASSNH